MNSTATLHSLGFSNLRTYFATALFVIGNIVLPQLFHLFPHGGMIWLPIYFFTLVGAYKYGWRVGLMTAILSPTISSMAFGMPIVAFLPAIILKSSLLAIAARLAANYFHKATIQTLLLVVLAYQIVGTLGEWAIVGNLSAALQDFRIGVPGMLLQVFGGWWVINRINIIK